MVSDVDIVIAPSDHAHCFIWTSSGIESELSDEFSFKVPGIEYMQKFRKQRWDGRVRLYNKVSKQIYVGLVPKIIKWAKKRGYTYDNRIRSYKTTWTEFDTKALLNEYPVPFDVRDYQELGITHALSRQRCVILSPTASGKSLVLYYIVRARAKIGPVLLIVPNVSLVSQMVSDWEGYGWTTVGDDVHKITAGKSKDTDCEVVCSTWQSIYKLDPEWFARYKSVIIDECHLAKAESLRGIMERMPHCVFRMGVTGTLDDAKANSLMVEGVCGPPFRVASTSDLQTQGHLTPILVQAHFLQYNEQDRHTLREVYRSYQEEMDFIVQHKGRMKWLVKFLGLLPGNVLVLANLVEKHCVPLYETLHTTYPQRPIHYVTGEVNGEDREDIRALIETQDNSITVASFGAFSTGVNVKRFHHVVLASPSKSRYRVLQSIGRGLRLHETKKLLYVHDIVDDAHNSRYHNNAFKHWAVRERFYKEESFPTELYTHEIPE